MNSLISEGEQTWNCQAALEPGDDIARFEGAPNRLNCVEQWVNNITDSVKTHSGKPELFSLS